jgi:hypothetical protein
MLNAPMQAPFSIDVHGVVNDIAAGRYRVRCKAAVTRLITDRDRAGRRPMNLRALDRLTVVLIASLRCFVFPFAWSSFLLACRLSCLSANIWRSPAVRLNSRLVFARRILRDRIF